MHSSTPGPRRARARLRTVSLGLVLGVLATGHPALGEGTLCPNGVLVARGPCTLCPDGSYVGTGALCAAQDRARTVASGSRTLPAARQGHALVCPDGSFVTGSRCVLSPQGRYVGS